MVDRADPVFFGAVWRFADFCQQLNAGSVYLQSVLKYRRAALRFRAQAGQVTAKGTICSFVGDLSHLASSKVPTLTCKHECPCKPRVRSEAPNRFFAPPNGETKN